MLRPSVLDLLMGEYKARYDLGNVVEDVTDTPVLSPVVCEKKILMSKKEKALLKKQQKKEIVRGTVSRYIDGKLVSSV